LGDSGDGAVDLDDPPDGLPDSWVAWLHNASGSAEVVATAVCAPVDSVAVALKKASHPDPLTTELRKALGK